MKEVNKVKRIPQTKKVSQRKFGLGTKIIVGAVVVAALVLIAAPKGTVFRGHGFELFTPSACNGKGAIIEDNYFQDTVKDGVSNAQECDEIRGNNFKGTGGNAITRQGKDETGR